MRFLKYFPVTTPKYEHVFCEFGQRLQSDGKEWEKTSILSWNINCVAVCYEWLSLSSTPSFSPQMIALAPVVSSSSPHALCSWSPGGRDSNTSHTSLPVGEVVIPEAKRTEDLLDKRLCYKNKNRKLKLKWQSYRLKFQQNPSEERNLQDVRCRQQVLASKINGIFEHEEVVEVTHQVSCQFI